MALTEEAKSSIWTRACSSKQQQQKLDIRITQ
jgi:hypothetical protein